MHRCLKRDNIPFKEKNFPFKCRVHIKESIKVSHFTDEKNSTVKVLFEEFLTIIGNKKLKSWTLNVLSNSMFNQRADAKSTPSFFLGLIYNPTSIIFPISIGIFLIFLTNLRSLPVKHIFTNILSPQYYKAQLICIT